MTDHSVNAPQIAPHPIVEWVRYEGVDALKEGEAVCHNTDYGTAANVDGRRHNHVERPSLDNNGAFAGVAARDYAARSTGQLIEIYIPGSKGITVALGVDTVLGTGLLTFVAGAVGSHRGRFYSGKYAGRGSAIPRQTVTAVLEADMTGAWSLATDGVTLTVTSTAGVTAGDTCVLLGGEMEDASKYVVPGKYTIASVTDAADLVLSASAVNATPAAAVTCTGYIYTGNPKCQADLLTGNESYGVEFISMLNAGGDDVVHMVGGVSYVCGELTLAADAEVELAQGVLPGDLKCFICLGAMTTSDFVIDLVTAGIQLDGATALAEINAIDAAADAAYLQFQGARWFTQDLAGGATQA